MSKYKVIMFGTVGWVPTAKRETPCICVDSGDSLFIFDAGTGISNFSGKIGLELILKYKEVHLFLSHFHLDHVIGLSYLPLFFKDKDFYLYGPGKNITGLSVVDTLNNLFKKPLFPLSLKEFPLLSLEVKDIDLGETSIGNHKIEIILQEHSDPSIGIKLDDVITYITDTPCSEKSIKFAEGSKILIHETWYDEADYRMLIDKDEFDTKVHSHSGGVAEIAKEAKVDLLALVHLNPAYSEERYKNMLDETKKIFAKTIIPNDLDIVEV